MNDKTWLNASREESSTRAGYPVEEMEKEFQNNLEEILKILIVLNDGVYVQGLVVSDRVFKEIATARWNAVRNHVSDIRPYSTRFVPNVSLCPDGNTPRFRFGVRYVKGRLPTGKRLPRDKFNAMLKTKYFSMSEVQTKAEKWSLRLLSSEPDWVQECFTDASKRFEILSDTTKIIGEIRRKIYELSRAVKKFHDCDREEFPEYLNDSDYSDEFPVFVCNDKVAQSMVLNSERYREIVMEHIGRVSEKKQTKNSFEKIIESLDVEDDDWDRGYREYRSRKKD